MKIDPKEFRHEVRLWLDENCPIEMREPIVSDEDTPWGGRKFHWTEPQRRWLDAMVDRGWTVPTWPVEYGGAGMTAEQAGILAEEMRRIGARPPLFSYGIVMLAPVLLKYGTEAQKMAHLPAIARGEIRWCQGYSEPGAGSDLASLQTRAIDCGDHFRVSGHKVWTSYADKADWAFCLVRTSPNVPKHQGISFLLIDMSAPGVTTAPIRLISGRSRFCEMFFDYVMVPKENLVGSIDQGWGIAKALLSHEREAISQNDLDAVDRMLGPKALQVLERDREGRLDDPMLRAEIARFDLDATAFDLMQRHAGARRAAPAIDLSPVLKYLGTELNKRRQDLLMSIAGSEGTVWDWDDNATGVGARSWLYSRADSIKGGTSEIQLNIIAKRILGLP